MQQDSPLSCCFLKNKNKTSVVPTGFFFSSSSSLSSALARINKLSRYQMLHEPVNWNRALSRPSFFFSSFFHLDTRSKSKHSPPHLLISIPLKNKKILWCLLLLLQYANKLLSRVRKGNFGVKLFQRGKTLESKSESVGYFIGADRKLDTYAKKKRNEK